MPERPVVVLDANIFISAILWGGKPLKLVDRWRYDQAVHVAMSPELLVEILAKLRNKFGLPVELMAEWRELLESGTLHVLPEYRTTICRDPKDNMYLDTAIAAQAAFLVPGDKDLLDLGRHQGVATTRVADLLKALGLD